MLQIPMTAEACRTVPGADPVTSLIEVMRARPLLGTIVEIRAASLQVEATRLHAAVDAAFDRIELVHRLMSYHDTESELSRLNRCPPGHAQRIDTHTYEVLSAAVYFARISAGAFDPCVADCLEQWGYLPAASRAPAARAAPSALAAPAALAVAPRERPGERCAPPRTASWEDIELLSDSRARFKRPMRLDLGGIAKGYAVDLAIETLLSAHVSEIVVNAGGDMRVAGNRIHHVYLRHPQAPTVRVNPLHLRNSALASSAPYFSRRLVGARQVSALLDPRTREPYVFNNGVSVRAKSCMAADALTKIVLFAPASIAERVLDECGAEAFVLQGEA